jgi:hypothetical protein
VTASTWWSLGDTGASFTVEPNVAIGWNYGGGDPGNAWGPVFIDIDSDHKLVVVADASGGFYLWVVDCTIPAAPIIGPSYAQGAAYGLTEQTLAVTGQSIFVTSGPFAATEIVQLYWDPATLAISSVGSQTGSNASAQERIVLLTDTMLLCSNGSSEWNTLPITGGVLQPVSGTISVNSTLHPLVVPSTYGGNIILCSDIGSTTTLQAVLPSGSTGTPATLPAGSPTTQLSFSIDGQTDQFWQFQVVNGFPLRDLYLFAVDSAGNLTSTLAASAQEANWADQQFLPAPTMEGVAPVGSVTRSTIPRLSDAERPVHPDDIRRARALRHQPFGVHRLRGFEERIEPAAGSVQPPPVGHQPGCRHPRGR